MLDIMKFVCTDPHRPNICSPWTKNGYHYATNGRVAIRIPAKDDFEYPDIDGARPDCDSVVLSPQGTALGWVAVDSFENEPNKPTKCLDCEGTGHTFVTCGKCNGCGEIECDECRHSHECEECCGDGTVSGQEICPECNGTKTVLTCGNIVTPSGVVDGKYLALFAGFEMGIVPEIHKVIPMRCGDVLGALIPIHTSAGDTNSPFAGLYEAVIAMRKELGVE